MRKQYDERHGGPYDRGSADSYYRRGKLPHYYKGDTYNSERVDEAYMTLDEIEAYNAGFDDNEAESNFKDYGD